MSGFDTSQPIADEKALEDVEPKDEMDPAEGDEAGPVDADKLGDAALGPR